MLFTYLDGDECRERVNWMKRLRIAGSAWRSAWWLTEIESVCDPLGCRSVKLD